MKIAIALILGASTSVAPMTATWAQFVKGNEAVFQTASGRKVETPPVTASIGKPCAAAAHCHAGAWNMVETADGLAECTEPSARPTTCRPSTYGTQKLPRLWVVKRGTVWLWCQYPDAQKSCVDMAARPPANLIVAIPQ